MKPIVPIASFACLLAISATLRAQSEVGSWKLNTVESRFSGIEAPKRVTMTLQPIDGGIMNHTQGVSANGSPINFTYSAKYDGTETAITGSGAWNGSDAVALKRVDANTIELTYKKSGTVVNKGRISISPDAKVMTITAQGTSPDGKPTDVRIVYEKH
jgi:hypothetical protein